MLCSSLVRVVLAVSVRLSWKRRSNCLKCHLSEVYASEIEAPPSPTLAEFLSPSEDEAVVCQWCKLREKASKAEGLEEKTVSPKGNDHRPEAMTTDNNEAHFERTEMTQAIAESAGLPHLLTWSLAQPLLHTGRLDSERSVCLTGEYLMTLY